ncbi:hypothetical protein [Lacipirellula parvula]|uniref:Uncharacterized protein n=1 Tax=Lacipirellula parvula TaxID=2650471 RepID=A0A5K7XDG9_9BACT|nr:hypothetical protein [Lacipirellula parvula]BBO34435.1 hypothetical protein PLANPX_4047 [Lacipirellula parvula]
MNQLVTALAIQRWANQLTSRSTLPLVLRRLAHTTLADISEIDFPVGESTQRSGFDGTITCEAGNAWVPAGKSVWEFGVNKGVKSKADDDFEKRTQETSPAHQTESGYIAVTPRHWKNKKKWADEQASNGCWKEVRAYDADDIEQWVETAPAVGVWFAQLLGLQPSDTDDIEHRWKAIIESTKVSLQPEVFLTSRDASEKQFSKWAFGDSQCLTFASRSPSEVISVSCRAVSIRSIRFRVRKESRRDSKRI